jgi:hypothetical protein
VYRLSGSNHVTLLVFHLVLQTAEFEIPDQMLLLLLPSAKFLPQEHYLVLHIGESAIHDQVPLWGLLMMDFAFDSPVVLSMAKSAHPETTSDPAFQMAETLVSRQDCLWMLQAQHALHVHLMMCWVTVPRRLSKVSIGLCHILASDYRNSRPCETSLYLEAARL